MLLELAKGDSYGIGFEFAKMSYIEENHDLLKYRASVIDAMGAGTYSDDTQMSMAVTELILNEPSWNNELIGGYFLKAFKRDQRQGYARKFYKFLLETENEIDFVNKIKSKGRITNGSVMRSVPMGVISNINELVYKSELQTRVTHDSEEAVKGSLAIAIASHYFIYFDLDLSAVLKIVRAMTRLEIDLDKKSRTECDALDTVDAVFTVLSKSSSMLEILDRSVKLGGDTDSVASIALGLASSSSYYNDDLPEFLEKDLENGEFGRDYIKKLDLKLNEKIRDGGKNLYY